MRTYIPMTRAIMLAGAALLLAAAAPAARAHAFLQRSTPRVGQHVKRAPKQVRLTFDEYLDATSTVAVYDAAGDEVDNKDAHLDKDDASQMIVSLKPLTAGKYRVKWHATAKDGHKTQGDFTFTVD